MPPSIAIPGTGDTQDEPCIHAYADVCSALYLVTVPKHGTIVFADIEADPQCSVRVPDGLVPLPSTASSCRALDAQTKALASNDHAGKIKDGGADMCLRDGDWVVIYKQNMRS